MEISLRIRTDDLRGFRYYDTIRRVLLHELTHMVHDEHGIEFNELCSSLTREATEGDWTQSTGRLLIGGSYADAPPSSIGSGTASGTISGDGEYVLGRSPSTSVRGGAVRDRMAAAALGRAGAVPQKAPRHTHEGRDNTTSVGTEQHKSPPLTNPLNIDREARHKADGTPDDNDVRLIVSGDTSSHVCSGSPSTARSQSTEECHTHAQDDVNRSGASEISVDIPHKLTTAHHVGGSDAVPMEIDTDGDATLDAAFADAESVARVRTMRNHLVSLSSTLSKNGAALVAALETLRRIIGNVIDHPRDDKYRRIRTSNSSFYSRVGKYTDAIAFLTGAGFALSDGQGGGGQDGDLRLYRDDPGLLWMAAGILDDLLSRVSPSASSSSDLHLQSPAPLSADR
eukprot:Opistho-2@86021